MFVVSCHLLSSLNHTKQHSENSKPQKGLKSKLSKSQGSFRKQSYKDSLSLNRAKSTETLKKITSSLIEQISRLFTQVHHPSMNATVLPIVWLKDIRVTQ